MGDDIAVARKMLWWYMRGGLRVDRLKHVMGWWRQREADARRDEYWFEFGTD